MNEKTEEQETMEAVVKGSMTPSWLTKKNIAIGVGTVAGIGMIAWAGPKAFKYVKGVMSSRQVTHMALKKAAEEAVASPL